MPEPDFLTPTVFTPTKLSFGSLIPKSSRGGTTNNSFKKASNSSPTLFGGLSGLFGNDSQFRTNDQVALDAVNRAISFPQINTVKADGGGTKFMAALKNTAGAILASMGSGGDGGETVTVTPASFGATKEADGILGDPVVLIGLVIGAGVVIYMATK